MTNYVYGLLLLVILSTGCTKTDTSENEVSNSEPVSGILSGSDFYNKLDSLARQLDACKELDDDCLGNVNRALDELLTSPLTTAIFSNVPKGDRSSHHIAVSPNASLIVISFDSRMGGSSKDYKAYALVNNKNETKTYLLDLKGGPYWIDRVGEVPSGNDQTVYLLIGSGTASSYEYYQSIIATTFQDGVSLASVFPGSQSMIRVDYDLSVSPEFILKESGTVVQVPVVRYDSILAYRHLQYNGSVFVAEKNTSYQQITPGDFNSDAAYGLMKGSERPSAVDEATVGKSYQFSDLTVIENESGLLVRQTGNSKEGFLNQLIFRGKKGDYLFLEGVDGTADSWPLFVYSIKQNAFVFGETVSMSLIRDQEFLYMSSDDWSSDQKLECGTSEMYVKLRVVRLTGQVPLLQLTDNGFCIYVQ